MAIRDVLRQLLSTFSGKAGVALLGVLILLSLVAVVIFPFDWGKKEWSDPARWADNPKAAAPVWVNWFPGIDKVRQKTLEGSKPNQTDTSDSGKVVTYTLPADFNSSRQPTFVSFTLRDVAFYDRPPLVTVTIVRPDGAEATVLRQVLHGPREGEQAPYQRFYQDPLRIVLTGDTDSLAAIRDFYRDTYGTSLSQDLLRDHATLALFGQPDPNNRDAIVPLPGHYEFRVRAILSDSRDAIGPVKIVAAGEVFGVMGTDALGRDLAQALLFGLPVALLIGVVASVVTTVIGTTLGVISGYAGGATDTLIQRFSDVVNNVPLLPLLIFFVFVVGSNLWLIILFLVAFSWPGLTILVRSMVLQVRTGQLVESAVTMGASKWRIMRKHIFPSMAPFVFAQMIFFAPAAILAESGLSFLGLGDPNIPTWGQILESGFRTGAVYLGYWWWVVPPGILIIITALTFMFLSLAMEPVVNPRLRRVK